MTRAKASRAPGEGKAKSDTGLSRGKATQAAGNGASPGKADGISNMEAVRRALGVLGPKARPPEIGAYVQQHFGKVIPPNHISSYKSTLTRKARKPGRPRVGADGDGRADGASDVLTLKDLRAIKELANRIGVARFRELVEVLYQ
jgi:hypothetical protein